MVEILHGCSDARLTHWQQMLIIEVIEVYKNLVFLDHVCKKKKSFKAKWLLKG
jgi:hypothetical protein